MPQAPSIPYIGGVHSGRITVCPHFPLDIPRRGYYDW